MLILIAVIGIVGYLLESLLDPRGSARVHMKRLSDERAGWDMPHNYDPAHRQSIVDNMVKKELSGEKDWYRVYKSVLDKEGITELEIKREIERRGSSGNS